MSDIDTVAVDSLKALDPNRPIREADIGRTRNARTDHHQAVSILFNDAEQIPLTWYALKYVRAARLENKT